MIIDPTLLALAFVMFFAAGFTFGMMLLFTSVERVTPKSVISETSDEDPRGD